MKNLLMVAVCLSATSVFAAGTIQLPKTEGKIETGGAKGYQAPKIGSTNNIVVPGTQIGGTQKQMQQNQQFGAKKEEKDTGTTAGQQKLGETCTNSLSKLPKDIQAGVQESERRMLSGGGKECLANKLKDDEKALKTGAEVIAAGDDEFTKINPGDRNGDGVSNVYDLTGKEARQIVAREGTELEKINNLPAGQGTANMKDSVRSECDFISGPLAEKAGIN